jgi:spoIIIJ-associated protein
VAPADEPAPETLAAVVREVVQSVLTPIIGPTELEIEAEPGRVKVLIRDEENSGLIIGREGQTIAALQYIVNRIVARRLPTSARVHLDAGDYRQRQDDNLQRMALYLADKVKNQNRPQSTKPLSSYHRRLVHLALQHDAGIVTSSKGDGPLKRVLIHPRRNGGTSANRQPPDPRPRRRRPAQTQRAGTSYRACPFALPARCGTGPPGNARFRQFLLNNVKRPQPMRF